MSARAIRLTDIDIDNALSNAHLETVFQPIVRFSDRKILRYEVFVRWNHPGLGVLPPGAFLSFFESQGRIGELTRYVVRHSLAAYQKANLDDAPGLSINLSLADLRDNALPNDILEVLAEFEVEPSVVTLECPPLAPDTSASEQQDVYSRIAATGCPLTLEVRSRHPAGLEDITPFPFAEIKCGGSAILRYGRTSRGAPSLAGLAELIDFAKARDAQLVAVGVEDGSTISALSGIGFVAGQGNALGRAGPLGHVTGTEPQDRQTSGLHHAIERVEERASTPLNLSAVESDRAAAQSQRQARIAAAKRSALRRFQAARNSGRPVEEALNTPDAADIETTARQLQDRLELSFVDGDVPDNQNSDKSTPVSTPTEDHLSAETAPSPTAQAASETPVSAVEAPMPQSASASTADAPTPASSAQAGAVSAKPTPIAAILSSLEAYITERGSVRASVPTPDEIEADFVAPDDVLDGIVAQSPLADEDATSPDAAAVVSPGLVVPPRRRARRKQNFLTRKYRITHFWPRSWKRAMARRAARRAAGDAQTAASSSTG